MQTIINYRKKWETDIAQKWVHIYIYLERDNFGQVKATTLNQYSISFNVNYNGHIITLDVQTDDNYKVTNCEDPVCSSMSVDEAFEAVFNVNEQHDVEKARCDLTIQYLRFIPKTYVIEITGVNCGVNLNCGEISEKAFRYWNQSKHSVSILSDDDHNVYIPDYAYIHKQCEHNLIDDLCDISGIEFDCSTIVVFDECGNKVFECDITDQDLSNNNITVDVVNQYVMDPNKNYFYWRDLYDDVLFRAEISLTSDFDPSKIKLESEHLVSFFQYASAFTYDNKPLINLIDNRTQIACGHDADVK